MTGPSKVQRTFKFDGTTTDQIEQLCRATGSNATAIIQQSVARYYREMFGPDALYRFASRPTPVDMDGEEGA